MSVGVIKDYKLKLRDLLPSHTLGWSCGTGIPKDRDEVNHLRREVCECDGWVCDLDVMDVPSKLNVIRKASALGRVRPTFLLRWGEKGAWRKWNKPQSVWASWTPEDVKKTVSFPMSLNKSNSSTESFCFLMMFIIRVKRELQRVYRNGCRYNERLNTETGGSKTPRTHWVARVNI